MRTIITSCVLSIILFSSQLIQAETKTSEGLYGGAHREVIFTKMSDTSFTMQGHGQGGWQIISPSARMSSKVGPGGKWRPYDSAGQNLLGADAVLDKEGEASQLFSATVIGDIVKEQKTNGRKAGKNKIHECDITAKSDAFYIRCTAPTDQVNAVSKVVIPWKSSATFASYEKDNPVKSNWTVDGTDKGYSESISVGSDMEPGEYSILATKGKYTDSMTLLILKLDSIDVWDSDDRHAANDLLEVVPPKGNETLFGKAIFSPDTDELPESWPGWVYVLRKDGKKYTDYGANFQTGLMGWKQKPIKSAAIKSELNCNNEHKVNVTSRPYNAYNYKTEDQLLDRRLENGLNKILGGLFDIELRLPKWATTHKERWKERERSNLIGWTTDLKTKTKAKFAFPLKFKRPKAFINKNLNKINSNVNKAQEKMIKTSLSLANFNLGGTLTFEGKTAISSGIDEYGNKKEPVLDNAKISGKIDVASSITLSAGLEIDNPLINKLLKNIKTIEDRIESYLETKEKIKDRIKKLSENFRGNQAKIFALKKKLKQLNKRLREADRFLKKLKKQLKDYREKIDKLLKNETHIKGELAISGQSYIEFYDAHISGNVVYVRARVGTPKNGLQYKAYAMVSIPDILDKPILVGENKFHPAPGYESELPPVEFGKFRVFSF
jgi:uncharacterized protein YukE